MNRRCLTASTCIALTAMLAGPAAARGGHSATHPSSHVSSHSLRQAHEPRARAPAPLAGRDGRGRLTRSKAARRDFEHSHPCPSTGRSNGACPGYVVDHVVPLKRGGPDAPSNMQWQTIAEGKAKDRIE